MSSFLLIVRGLAPVIYFLAAGGVLLGVRSFMQARYQLRLSQFSLEREQAEEKGGWAITQTLVMIQVIVLVYLLSTITYDSWERHQSGGLAPTAPPPEIPFQTDVPQGVGEGFQQPTAVIESLGIIQTPKPSPTFAGTVLPADAPLGCTVADQVNITLPTNGQVVFAVQTIMGTANVQNFGFYRFEIRNMDTWESFGVIEGNYTSPVADNGVLGTLIPQNFAPGEYRFRLAVFDTSSSLVQACEITIFISDPLPTATPIGAGIQVPTSPATPE